MTGFPLRLSPEGRLLLTSSGAISETCGDVAGGVNELRVVHLRADAQVGDQFFTDATVSSLAATMSVLKHTATYTGQLDRSFTRTRRVDDSGDLDPEGANLVEDSDNLSRSDSMAVEQISGIVASNITDTSQMTAAITQKWPSELANGLNTISDSGRRVDIGGTEYNIWFFVGQPVITTKASSGSQDIVDQDWDTGQQAVVIDFESHTTASSEDFSYSVVNSAIIDRPSEINVFFFTVIEVLNTSYDLATLWNESGAIFVPGTSANLFEADSVPIRFEIGIGTDEDPGPYATSFSGDAPQTADILSSFSFDPGQSGDVRIENIDYTRSRTGIPDAVPSSFTESYGWSYTRDEDVNQDSTIVESVVATTTSQVVHDLSIFQSSIVVIT